MAKPLLDVIFASEKRKGVLLLLQDGAKEMEPLLKSLNTTRQALLPQVKVLEEHYLVDHYDDTYELTTIGKLLVDNMKRLIDKIEVFDVDIDYWGTRNLDFIPPHLLEKTDELKTCKIISPPIAEIYSFHKSFNPDFEVSTSVYIVTAFLYPDFYAILTDMLENNLTIHYIVSQELLDKIRKEYDEEFATLLNNKSFSMYFYNKEMSFLFLVLDSIHSLLGILKDTGEFDYNFVLCQDKSAVQWSKELFEYYLKNSTPVTRI